MDTNTSNVLELVKLKQRRNHAYYLLGKKKLKRKIFERLAHEIIELEHRINWLGEWTEETSQE